MKSLQIFPPIERPLLEDLEQDPYREEGLVKAIQALQAIEKEYQELKEQFVDGRYFTITTSPEVAEKIRKQCEWDKKFGDKRSFRLGEIRTEKGLVSDYSVVQIIAKNGNIEPSDIFFLGLFASNK